MCGFFTCNIDTHTTHLRYLPPNTCLCRLWQHRHIWFSSSVPSGWDGKEICIQNFGLEISEHYLQMEWSSMNDTVLAGSVWVRSRWSCWSWWLTFRVHWDIRIQSFALRSSWLYKVETPQFIGRGLRGLQNQSSYHGKRINLLLLYISYCCTVHLLCSASYKQIYYNLTAQIFDFQMFRLPFLPFFRDQQYANTFTALLLSLSVVNGNMKLLMSVYCQVTLYSADCSVHAV